MVTIEDEKKTFKYKETTNLDIENISSTSQQIWKSIYGVIHDYYFKSVKFFPTKVYTNVKKTKMNLRTYKMKSKQHKKRWLCKWVVYTSGYDPHEELR